MAGAKSLDLSNPNPQLYHLSGFVYQLDLAQLYQDCKLSAELFEHFCQLSYMAAQTPMDAHDGQEKLQKYLGGNQKDFFLGGVLLVWHS